MVSKEECQPDLKESILGTEEMRADQLELVDVSMAKRQ